MSVLKGKPFPPGDLIMQSISNGGGKSSEFNSAALEKMFC